MYVLIDCVSCIMFGGGHDGDLCLLLVADLNFILSGVKKVKKSQKSQLWSQCSISYKSLQYKKI